MSLILLVLVSGIACAAPAPAPTVQGKPVDGIRLSPEQALAVGKNIWQNESGGTVDGLTHWNVGEDFASLGIGHFIWYRAGARGPFTESFPPLLDFLGQHDVRLPKWLRGRPPCPWKSREAFFADFRSKKMKELRKLLESTVPQQALFAAKRLEEALPSILAGLPESEQETIRRRFYAVAEDPGGVYALVDYVNFKGEGISPSERYQKQGWGLLQVLQEMKDAPAGKASVQSFADAADRILTRRVSNSPPERNEQRWLPGWRKRLKTYAAP